jgi:predicted transcriptional regulator
MGAHTSTSDTLSNKTSTARPRQLGIRLPPDMIARLESIARAEHNGISAVVRRLLTVALEAK